MNNMRYVLDKHDNEWHSTVYILALPREVSLFKPLLLCGLSIRIKGLYTQQLRDRKLEIKLI